MLELIVTGGMTFGSVLLFGYWFRYTCMLILSTKTIRDHAGSMAAVHQLSFLQVQSQLRGCASDNLARLHDALDRDYAIVMRLLAETPSSAQGQSGLESWMLQMNYRLMGAWARVSFRFSPAAACRALDEMSQVVAHFANAMGELAATPAAA
jgi:hypothetical protein